MSQEKKKVKIESHAIYTSSVHWKPKHSTNEFRSDFFFLSFPRRTENNASNSWFTWWSLDYQHTIYLHTTTISSDCAFQTNWTMLSCEWPPLNYRPNIKTSFFSCTQTCRPKTYFFFSYSRVASNRIICRYFFVFLLYVHFSFSRLTFRLSILLSSFVYGQRSFMSMSVVCWILVRK